MPLFSKLIKNSFIIDNYISMDTPDFLETETPLKQQFKDTSRFSNDS